MKGFNSPAELESLIADLVGQLESGEALGMVIAVANEDGSLNAHYLGKAEVCQACVTEELVANLINLDIQHGSPQFLPPPSVLATVH